MEGNWVAFGMTMDWLIVLLERFPLPLFQNGIGSAYKKYWTIAQNHKF